MGNLKERKMNPALKNPSYKYGKPNKSDSRHHREATICPTNNYQVVGDLSRADSQL